MCPDTLIWDHFPGHLTSARRCTISAHDIVCAAACSRRCIRAVSPAIDVTEILTTIAPHRLLSRARQFLSMIFANSHVQIRIEGSRISQRSHRGGWPRRPRPRPRSPRWSPDTPEEIQLPARNESGLVQFDIAIGARYCLALLN